MTPFCFYLASYCHIKIYAVFLSPKTEKTAVKKILTIVLLLCTMSAGSIMAWGAGIDAGKPPKQDKQEKTEHPLRWRNELRIGWGDQLFESLMWHNPTSVITTMPETFSKTYLDNFSHRQHVWLEYQYFCAYWFSIGVMADVSEVGWNEVTRNGKGVETGRSERKYFYNAVVMPTLRFTYFQNPYCSVHSGLGVGLNINGGTEENALHQKTEAGLAVNLTLVGVSVGYERWFMAFDLGGLTSLRDKNTIYMVFSRMMNVSIGVRF